MSWDTYTLSSAKYKGATGRSAVPSSDVQAAARTLVQDVAREYVAQHFEAQGSETAFWDAAAAIGELSDALDAMFVYASAFYDFGGLFGSGQGVDDIKRLMFYDPNDQPRPSGLLVRAVKGFAVSVGGAILRDDSATSVNASVQSSQDDETFSTTNLANFARMD